MLGGGIFSCLLCVIAPLVASQRSAQIAVLRLTADNTYRGRLLITMVALLASLVALLAPAAPSVKAQATPPAELVLLGPQQQLTAGLYRGAGPNASTALFVFHDTLNSIIEPPCVQLVQRGFTALCTKTPFTSTGHGGLGPSCAGYWLRRLLPAVSAWHSARGAGGP